MNTKNIKILLIEDDKIEVMKLKRAGNISVDSNSETITKGETVLIPACSRDVLFSCENASFLEIYSPN